MAINLEIHKNHPIFVCPITGDSFDNFGDDTPYPVINDIPRFVLPSSYADAFGDQWLRWRKTQLDSFSGTTISRDRLYRCLGPIGRNLLNSSSICSVLEVGAGAGRFTEILLEYPSVYLTSLDLSKAVDANSENFPQDLKHRIVQSDIMNPPFLPEQFDVVICLGVIQHTPIPEATIKKLFDQCKTGGFIVFDHYRPEIRRLTKLGFILRPFVKRLNPSAKFKVIELLVSIFFPVHRLIRNIPFAQQVFSRISPLTTYFHSYPELSPELQRQWSLLDTHDGLTDYYKHYRTPKQIEKLLHSLNATEISVNIGGNGIEATCYKGGC